MKRVMTIAGSDPSGGAGIQADLKAIHSQGVYAASVITSVTAQNAMQVHAVDHLPAHLVRAQFEVLADDIEFHAFKTGMLGNADIVATVAELLARRQAPNVVVDPLVQSTSGVALLDDEGSELLRAKLFPVATVVTPNLGEAESLSGDRIDSIEAMTAAGRRILKFGPRCVVITGGHADFAPGTDVYVDAATTRVLEPDSPVSNPGVHGTGCVFSAVVAARLALGEAPLAAVTQAKLFLSKALRNAMALGSGFVLDTPDNGD